MNSLDKQYQTILQTILDYGVDKSDRTGTGTKSIFGYTLRHNMQDGFPLLTTKKVAVKTMMTELKWFLKGDTNIKYLVDNGCNIWNGDAYKKYISKQSKPKIGDWENYIDCYCGHTDTCDCGPLSQEEFINKIKTDDEFAEKWGELGPIYGKQWRRWKGDTWVEGNTDGTEGFYLQSETIDQIQNLINDLKTNPDSRRLMVNAWNVGELSEMTLPPCHYGFQCYTTKMSFEERVAYWTSSLGKDVSYAKRINDSDLDERGVPKRKLSLMWNQRSVDTFLGLPFNIASYGTLLLLLCEETGYMAGDLIGNLGDVHLYKNHIEQSKEQLAREPMKLPKLHITNVDTLNGEFDYVVHGYSHHDAIKAPLSN